MATGADDDDDDDDIDVTAQGAIPWENAHFYVPDSLRPRHQSLKGAGKSKTQAVSEYGPPCSLLTYSLNKSMPKVVVAAELPTRKPEVRSIRILRPAQSPVWNLRSHCR
jgi:hypothetical protein